jgi:hypothetical protein
VVDIDQGRHQKKELQVTVDPETPEEASTVTVFKEGDPIPQEEQLRPPIPVAVLIEGLIEVPLWGIMRLKPGSRYPTSEEGQIK